MKLVVLLNGAHTSCSGAFLQVCPVQRVEGLACSSRAPNGSRKSVKFDGKRELYVAASNFIVTMRRENSFF